MIAGKLCIRKAAICEKETLAAAVVCVKMSPITITLRTERQKVGFTVFGNSCEEGATT